jgi:hypothetical protein
LKAVVHRFVEVYTFDELISLLFRLRIKVFAGGLAWLFYCLLGTLCSGFDVLKDLLGSLLVVLCLDLLN